jgi:hypothetical protein
MTTVSIYYLFTYLRLCGAKSYRYVMSTKNT